MTTQQLVLAAIATGIIATVVLDLWVVLLHRRFKLTPTNWAVVGRWFAYMPRGQFRHQAIAQVPAVTGELLLGWSAHYVIGVGYAVIYVFVSRWLSVPISFASALVFGLLTLLAPWFIMQPGLGLGICASRAPAPNRMRLQNFANHLVFASAMYLAWEFCRPMPG